MGFSFSDISAHTAVGKHAVMPRLSACSAITAPAAPPQGLLQGMSNHPCTVPPAQVHGHPAGAGGMLGVYLFMVPKLTTSLGKARQGHAKRSVGSIVKEARDRQLDEPMPGARPQLLGREAYQLCMHR